MYTTGKILSLIILITFLIGVMAGAGGFYFVPKILKSMAEKPTESAQISNVQDRIAKQQKNLETMKKNFPEVLQGIISLSDSETKITTDSGKEYIFYPNQPKIMYESLGIKDRQKVQVQAKFLDQNKIQWGSIKAI